MTSQAKIEANRRKALKSTGPKSSFGKAKSSQNARRHGMNAAPAASETLARYRVIMAKDDVTLDPDEFDERSRIAFNLAKAEVRLSAIREQERALLKEYPDFYENAFDDRGLVQSLMNGNILDHSFSRKEANDILRITGMGMKGGQFRATKEFALMRRYMSEAERDYLNALEIWCALERSRCHDQKRTNPTTT